MADPFTIMAAVGMGAAAVGGVVGAVGAESKGAAQSAQYQYQAGIAQMNETIAKQNADYEFKAGEVSAQQSGMKSRAELGQAKAVQSASGLDVNSGSPADVRKSMIEVGQENQAVIRSNAARKAYGYATEAAGQEAQSNLYGMAASNSKTAAHIEALGSIIGGVSSVSTKWSAGGSAGLFGGNPVNVGSATSYGG